MTALTTSALDNRDSTVSLMLYANFQAASHTKFAPNLPPPKPDLRLNDPSVELSKYSEQSLTSVSVFEIFKIARVDLEILEKRYIWLSHH